MWACCRGAWRALCTVHSALVANTQEHVAGERGEHCVLCTVTWCQYSRTCCRGAWRALCTVHSALGAITQEHVAGERGEHCALCTVHLVPLLKNMLQGSVESTVHCHLVPLLKNMLQGSAESTVHCALSLRANTQE